MQLLSSSLLIILTFLATTLLYHSLVERYEALSYSSKPPDNLYPNSSNTAHSDFNFIAVGDWDCTEDTKATVNNIISQDPELIAGLGDYSAIGNHDDADQILAKLKEYFDLEQEYYSFDYENVHFIVLATESGYLDMDTRRAQEQLAFVRADLEEASSDPNTDWIIPFFHQMMYYEDEESSIVEEDDDNLSGIYHPIFEKYGVNLVLFAHSHTYERTYPIKFNEDDTDNPIVTKKDLNNYDLTNGGLVAVTVGTAGADLSGLHGDPRYTPIQIEDSYGFLDVQVLKDENKLVGTFYDNNADKKDEFTIQKKYHNSSIIDK